MANQKLYWTGPGVVGIGNKEYGADDALPVKDIDSDTLARWKDAGKIGTKIAVVVVDKRDTTIAELEESNKNLIAQIIELPDGGKELKKAVAILKENVGGK